MTKEIEIPKGYEAKIEGNKVIIKQKESENERIRKALIDFFQKKAKKGFEWVEYGIPNNAVLAYLQKQKEQKPISTEETELNSIAFLEQLGYTCVPPGKEQKPAEWTIKDAKPGDILTTDTVTFIFKSIDKDGFVSMYCSYAASTTDTNRNLSDTSTVDSKYVHPASIEQRQEFLEEFLRHLSSHPHWKPSEKQMSFLLRLEGELRAGNHPVAAKKLAELYNDLKKL